MPLRKGYCYCKRRLAPSGGPWAGWLAHRKHPGLRCLLSAIFTGGSGSAPPCSEGATKS